MPTVTRPDQASAAYGSRAAAFVDLLRPRHAVKNLFVFLPALFSGDLTRPERWAGIAAAFAAFCLAAPSVYALNDVLDAASDRVHGEKARRAVASGLVAPREALAFGAVLLAGGSATAFFGARAALPFLAAYVALNALYSLRLKRVAMLDVMVIASGFILRLLAGASMCSVPPSSWVLSTTFFLALFLGFAKRRAELATVGASATRAVLGQYSLPMLDHLLAALMGATILSYSLYAGSDYTRARFHTDALIFTVPFVVYGMFRYFQQLLTRRLGESPTEALLTDGPTLLNVTLWAAACAWIIYGR